MTPYKISALIPARGGSKGVPRKNIKSLGKRPLIAYSIAACCLSKYIDKVYVSTEDAEIANIAEEYGAEVPFIRPEEYAADDSTDQDVLWHFFQNVQVNDLAFIRPTTPLRDPTYLDDAIEKYFQQRRDLTSMRSVHEIPESPYKLYKIENGYFQSFFDEYKGCSDYVNLPRQHFPKAYQPNGYIDIVRRDIVESGTTFGNRVVPYITNYVAEVDFPHQFELLQSEIETKGHKILDYLNENHRDKI